MNPNFSIRFQNVYEIKFPLCSCYRGTYFTLYDMFRQCFVLLELDSLGHFHQLLP